MGTSPIGVLQLLDSSQVTVAKQNSCFRRVYCVSTYQVGTLLRVKSKGSNSFQVKDTEGNLIATFKFRSYWFKMSSMEVKMCHTCPTVSIKPKGATSRSTLILDHDDQPILRVKHTRSFWSGKEYKILARDRVEIGSIRKDWSDYDLLYPPDLDVRYKTALIATIIFNDIKEDNASRASSSS